MPAKLRIVERRGGRCQSILLEMSPSIVKMLQSNVAVVLQGVLRENCSRTLHIAWVGCGIQQAGQDFLLMALLYVLEAQRGRPVLDQ